MANSNLLSALKSYSARNPRLELQIVEENYRIECRFPTHFIAEPWLRSLMELGRKYEWICFVNEWAETLTERGSAVVFHR